jgi:hypothetical protein
MRLVINNYRSAKTRPQESDDLVRRIQERAAEPLAVNADGPSQAEAAGDAGARRLKSPQLTFSALLSRSRSA